MQISTNVGVAQDICRLLRFRHQRNYTAAHGRGHPLVGPHGIITYDEDNRDGGGRWLGGQRRGLPAGSHYNRDIDSKQFRPAPRQDGCKRVVSHDTAPTQQQAKADGKAIEPPRKHEFQSHADGGDQPMPRLAEARTLFICIRNGV
jgi:hypothetical protein